MILVDTSAWVEFLRNTGSPVCNFVEEALAGEVAICDAVRMEVLAGARDEYHLMGLRRLLARAVDVPIESTDYDDAAALYRRCRRRGETPAEARRLSHRVCRHTHRYTSLAQPMPTSTYSGGTPNCRSTHEPHRHRSRRSTSPTYLPATLDAIEAAAAHVHARFDACRSIPSSSITTAPTTPPPSPGARARPSCTSRCRASRGHATPERITRTATCWSSSTRTRSCPLHSSKPSAT